MLRRFAAGAVVASITLAIATALVLMIPSVRLQQLSPLLALWCVAPCVWGLWAMLAPSGWVPERLPIWGTMLGIFAGLMAIFVLNVPSRILGVSVPATLRASLVLIIALFYYLLWTVVGVVYRKLPGVSPTPLMKSEPISLTRLIGTQVLAKVRAYRDETLLTFKLLGVESGGIWIETADFMEGMFRDSPDRPKVIVLFLPYAQILAIYHAKDAPWALWLAKEGSQ